jgi:hypothetical protein
MNDRFWKRARVAEGFNSCWLWQGSTHRQGYGRVGYKGNRAAFAHRVSWELTHGPIPDGAHVLHRCDNPPCVNPAHLFLGTHQDNMRDMADKGRAPGLQRRGAASSKAKLTDAQAARVKHGTEPLTALAAELGVTYQALHYIRKGVTWRHV